MKPLRALACSLAFGALAFLGCRGSVERFYDDGVVPDASVADAPGPSSSSSSSSSSGGDSGGDKERDASDDGPPPITAPATIKGTVVGLIGTGLVLQNNGADDFTVTTTGAFAFPTQVGPGQPYAVTVRSQPTGPSQMCTVDKGTGTAMGVDVLDVLVTCTTNAYPVSVNVTGLTTNQSVVLTNNGANDITVSQNGKATFANNVPSGGPFNVVVKSTTGAANCTVSGGAGNVVASAVESIVVNCTPGTFTISGTVTGLAGSLVLTTNGIDRTVSASTFSFPPLVNGTNYAITVKTAPVYPPADQTCTVSNGNGTLNGANVTNVAVTCTTKSYTISGTVTGYSGSGLSLKNGTDTKPVAGSGFSFTAPSGSPYAITVAAQPPGQSCSVTNGTGTVMSGNITNVAVACSALTLLSESFDTTLEGDLPAGWTNVSLVANSDWDVTDDGFGTRKSQPNAVHITNREDVRDTVLISPSFTVTSSTAKVSFWHHIDSEEDWDGGVLEIKIDNGFWRDIIFAGGSFAPGTGYNCTLEEEDPEENPLGGRDAWCGDATFETIANLPASAAGKTVQLRWRFGSDDGLGDEGWYVDNIVVTN